MIGLFAISRASRLGKRNIGSRSHDTLTTNFLGTTIFLISGTVFRP